MIKNLFESPSYSLPRNEAEFFKQIEQVRNRKDLVQLINTLIAGDGAKFEEKPANFFQVKWKNNGYVIDARDLKADGIVTYYRAKKPKDSLFGGYKFYESQINEADVIKMFSNPRKDVVKRSFVSAENGDIDKFLKEVFEEIKLNGGKVDLIDSPNGADKWYEVKYGNNIARIDMNHYKQTGYIKISTKYKEEWITRAVKATSKAVFKTSLLVAFSPFFFLGKIVSRLFSRRSNS